MRHVCLVDPLICGHAAVSSAQAKRWQQHTKAALVCAYRALRSASVALSVCTFALARWAHRCRAIAEAMQ
jgi:hypothetical protein